MQRERPSVRALATQCRALLAGLVLAGAASAVSAAGGLVFGVQPHLSAARIIDQYSLLRDELARGLGRPVTMVSAPDLPSFMARLREGKFDVVLVAPHLGRLAEKRDGWRRLARTGSLSEIIALGRAAGPLQRLADLRGRTLAIGARDDLARQVIDAALTRDGLALEQDVEVVESPSPPMLLQALMRGEADAGATSRQAWSAAPAGQREALKPIFAAPPLPELLLMAHARLGESAVQTLGKTLAGFHATPAGKAYFRKTRQIDFQPIDDAAMDSLDPYAQALEKALAAHR